MELYDLLTALTHVSSQLVGRWFSLPRRPSDYFNDARLQAIDQYRCEGIAGVSAQAWMELIEFDLSFILPSLYWLEDLLIQRKINLQEIVAACVRHFSAMVAGGGHAVSILSSNYPPHLREIARPPLLLTVKGNLTRLTEPTIAIIGSRQASYKSLQGAVDIGIGLAVTDWNVVSGGAIGCDIAVHEGMIASGMGCLGASIVFAGGLSQLYPRSNARTFSEIFERGGVFISERLWFQPACAYDFPSRNRIVSGMSVAVVVMSAALKSGSLITAHEALEQGRDVHVFMPDHDDVRLEGSKKLIEDGAFEFSSSEELLSRLHLDYGPLLEDFHCNTRAGHSRGSETRLTCQDELSLGTFIR